MKRPILLRTLSYMGTFVLSAAMESRLPSWQAATEEEVRQAVQRLDASWDKRLNP
jgi:hypothetical protein